jgi:sucrose-6-phosphate hydrolase SacC (GH32 family)
MNGGKYPHMPFNQQMSLPVDLTLRTFPEGVRLCTHPVKEVDALHTAAKKSFDGVLRPGENPLAGVCGDLFDIQLKIEPGAAKTITLNVRGTPIVYDVKSRRLSALGTSAVVDLVEGSLALRVFLDRSSIEVFTADGRVNMAYCFLPPEDNKTLSISSEGGDATIRSLDVWEMNSVWPK